MSRTCDRAEVLAGAIALGEATDAERNEYRAHLSACQRCLTSLSGERELERLSAVVATARDEESWEPALPPPWVAQRARRAKLLRYSASVGALAVALSVGLHFFVAATVGQLHPTPANPITVAYDGTHVTLNQRPRPITISHALPNVQPMTASVKPQPARIVVEHNVVTLSASQGGSPNALPQSVNRTDTQTVAVVATARPRSVRTEDLPQVQVNDRASAVVAQTTPQPMENHAESLAVMQPSIIRNAAPLGGESSINPQPPMIAYAQGAEGTTAFEVVIDTQGAPQKCTVTKSSGFLSLDEAVCKAAMKARYSAKTINGRAVTGLYHDAFTFHTEQSEQLPPASPRF